MNKFFSGFFESRIKAGITFFVVLLLMCLLYNFQHELFVRPHGYHSWRQTDGFSVISSYYYLGMDFLHPRIYQFISPDCLEMAEFPIAYYLCAVGYKIFGLHEWVTRLIHLILTVCGLWFLYKLLAEALADHFFALVLSLLLFTSPVFIFYSLTPMPDIVGISVSFIGLYYAYRYMQVERARYLVLAFIFYAVAGAIKPTAILSLLALISVLSLMQLINFFRPDSFVSFKKNILRSLGVFSVATLGTILAWWKYVSYFREKHHTSYFQTHANPIWETHSNERRQVLDTINGQWLNHYFNKPSLVIMVILVLAAFLIMSKQSRSAFLSYILLLGACISYFLFFFAQFYVHDYYIIVILPLFIASLFLFVYAVKSKYPQVFTAGWFRLAFLIFFISNIAYGAYKNHSRNTDPCFYKNDHKELLHIEPYLDSIGVARQDLVLYWGDFAPNEGLYLMNRRGWGKWALYDKNESWRIYDKLTRKKLDAIIGMGCKYIIVDQEQTDLNDEERGVIDHYKSHKIGDRDNVQIYALVE